MSNDLEQGTHAEKSAIKRSIDQAYDNAENLVDSIASVFSHGTIGYPVLLGKQSSSPNDDWDIWVKARLKTAAELKESVAVMEKNFARYREQFNAIAPQLQYSAPQLGPTEFSHSINGRFADSCLKALVVEMKHWGNMTIRVWSGEWIKHDDRSGLLQAWQEDCEECTFSVKLGHQIFDRLYLERGQLYRDHVPTEAIRSLPVPFSLWSESIVSELKNHQRTLAELMNQNPRNEVSIKELQERCDWHGNRDNIDNCLKSLIFRFNKSLKRLGDDRRVHRHNSAVKVR